jgi:hypothetical protein
VTAAASFVDLGEELVPVRGGFMEDSEDEELYPAPFWILPTVAAALIAHFACKLLIYYSAIYYNVI